MPTVLTSSAVPFVGLASIWMMLFIKLQGNIAIRASTW